MAKHIPLIFRKFKRTLKTKNNESGSILLSTMILILFLSFLIPSLALNIHHQRIQYNQMIQSYEAKTMLTMTEQLMTEKMNQKQSDQLSLEGEIIFVNGSVTINETASDLYHLLAELDSGFTSYLIVDTSVESHELEDVIENKAE